MAKITGSMVITTSDYKTVKFVGVDDVGNPVTIAMTDAINLGNVDMTIADKTETVPSIEYTATYTRGATETTEPWSIERTGTATGGNNIMLGTGAFYIGETAVALCKGGGSFKVEREFYNIEADGDMGPVKGRIILKKSVAKLTMNVLTILDRLTDMYPALTTVTE